MNSAEHRLRVNVKSLAAEAKFIREEIRRARKPETKNMLNGHRQYYLKPEARMAHLALAFVRGRPYRQVETNARTQPGDQDLLKKLYRFLTYDLRPDIYQVRSWLQQ